jgi:DNA-binding winged helix-turn-helix (wHTH) protein/TolB-like protein/tetratricopeptide (TPR) repeat protein
LTASGEPVSATVLAQMPDFALGGLRVRPGACRVDVGHRTVRIEPRVMQVLVVLARANGGTVTREALVASCWSGRVVSDDAIARVIAKVRAAGRLSDPAAFTVEAVPKVGFRLIAPAASLSEAPPRSRSPGGSQRRRFTAATLTAAAVAVCLVGALAAWALASWREPPRSGRVEVVAFSAARAGAASHDVAAVLSEGVQRSLARAGIQTAPGVASRAAGGTPASAEFRVAGEVDVRDGRVVASVQVLETRSGVLLWATRQTRPTGRLEGFEDAVGEAVASVLQCMLEDRAAYPSSMSAAVLADYLNGCEAILTGAYPRAVEFARRLVRARPDLPGPLAMHAIALNHLAWSSDDAAEAEALRAEARAQARRALRIAPDYAEAYQALATAYPNGRAWAQREAFVQRARELDPNFTPAHLYYITLLRETGRLREAYAVAVRAAGAADPRGAGARFDQIQLRAELEGAAAARTELAQVLDRGMARALERQIALWQMPPPEGAQALRGLFEQHHAAPYRACLSWHLAAVMRAPVRGLPADCARLPAGWRIRMLARQGDLDGAFAEAEKPTPPSAYSTVYLFQPELKRFRADPRFMPLAYRLGLVDFWRATNRWPDFCAEPDLPYDCRQVAGTFTGAGGDTASGLRSSP